MSESKDQDQAQLTPKPAAVGRRSFAKGLGAGLGLAALATVFGSDKPKTPIPPQELKAGQDSVLETTAASKIINKTISISREFVARQISIDYHEADTSELYGEGYKTYVREHLSEGNNEFLYRLKAGPNGTQEIGILLDYPSDLLTEYNPSFTRYKIAFSSIDPQILPNLSKAFEGKSIKSESLKAVAENLYNLPPDANLTWVPAQVPVEHGTTIPALRAIGSTPQGRIFEMYINTLGASELTVTEPTNVPEHVNPN
jgi:hypothetical protein